MWQLLDLNIAPVEIVGFHKTLPVSCSHTGEAAVHQMLLVRWKGVIARAHIDLLANVQRFDCLVHSPEWCTATLTHLRDGVHLNQLHHRLELQLLRQLKPTATP